MNCRFSVTIAAVLLASALAVQTKKGTSLSAIAKGSFEAKVTPQPSAAGDDPEGARDEDETGMQQSATGPAVRGL